MKKIFSLIVFFAMTAAFAQINYEPGYFIDNNGRKTECLIKNVAWKDNPDAFDYRVSESAETQKGLIKDISEFNVSSYKFRRFTVSVDRSSNIMDKMSSSDVPEWATQTVFLKVLVEGKATLYQYEDDNLVKYFFSTGDHSAPEQLMYREHRENGVIKTNYKFRQQLYNFMRDKISDTREFENLKYRKDALTELFVEYNGGSGEMKDLTVTQNKSSVNFKITPGVSFATITVEDDNTGNGVEFDFGSKLAFRIGAEVEYIMPFNNNKWSLFVDPNIQFYKNEGSERVYDYKAEYKFIELPVGLRHYMYLNNESKLFINIAYAVVLNMGDPYIEINNVKMDIRKSSNLAAGIGFAHKRYSAELRYGFGRGLADFYDQWGSTYSSIGLVLGYKIFDPKTKRRSMMGVRWF